MYSAYIASVSLILSHATISQAVNVLGFPRRRCDDQPVRSCLNLAPSTCCTFPTGGLIAQAAFFALLQECDLGIWYYESPGAGTQCGIARDTISGPRDYACLTAGENAPGGGGAWFDLAQCGRGRTGELLDGSDLAALQAEVGACTDHVLATLYAWPENEPGVYALTPTQEQYEDISRLPEAMNSTEEVEILRRFNATYYEDPALMPGYEQMAAYIK